MEKILMIPMSAPKIEFAGVCNRVSEIVNSYDPESLKIGTAYQKFADSLTKVDELKIKSQKLPYTSALTALVDQLSNDVKTLMRYINSMNNEGTDDTSTQSMYDFLTSYLKGYTSFSGYTQLMTISKMLTQLETETEIAASIQANDAISPLLDTLKTDYTNAKAKYDQQRKAKVEKAKAQTLKIKRYLYFRVRELFTAIEVASLTYTDLDYSVMINELNMEIKRLNNSNKKSTDTEQSDSTEATNEDEAAA